MQRTQLSVKRKKALFRELTHSFLEALPVIFGSVFLHAGHGIHRAPIVSLLAMIGFLSGLALLFQRDKLFHSKYVLKRNMLIIRQMMSEEFRNITGKSKKHRWIINQLINMMNKEDKDNE